jgi:Concanavalin A-like lectin/glucanases superfamily
LELGRWYDLLVVVSGSSMTLSIDGSEVGTFTSEGLAHPTKKTLRLSVPGKALVDDVKIWRKN